MSGKKDLIKGYGSSLSESDLDRLHILISDWQVLADLAGADVVLWLQQSSGRYIAGAHCRPATVSTVHLDDVVGLYASPMRAQQLAKVQAQGQILFPNEVRWAGSYSVMEGWVPVINQGKTIAVLSLEINAQLSRGAEEFIGWMSEVVRIICQMITEGSFPDQSGPSATRHGIPRVSDGAVLLDAEGQIRDLNPNARSCFRRLGITSSLNGELLAESITSHLPEQATIDETLAVVLMGKASWTTEVETWQATISLRCIPLYLEGERVGALLLCRDVTEMRRREREMMSKDAMIREIHHRVKNNLQTVSALLRMQARRSENQSVKDALGQAERRVAAIARVHQELSQNVDETVQFDNMIGRLLQLSAQTASTGQRIKTKFVGSFGTVNADAANALAVIISELVTNAVEHAFNGSDGAVTLRAKREENYLDVWVSDDGVGIGDEALSGLGTQIVQTMVRGELQGTINWEGLPEGGTQVHLRAPMLSKEP